MKTAEAKAELLDLLFEATNDGVVDWDIVTNHATYNDRWRFLLGWDEAEIPTTPMTWREVIHEQDRQEVEQALRDHLEQAWPFVQTARLQHRALGWRWILMRGAARRDSRGTAIRMVILFADIDERVRAESQVRALIEAIPDTMIRIRMDGTLLAVKHGRTLENSERDILKNLHTRFGLTTENGLRALLLSSIQGVGKKDEVQITPFCDKTPDGEIRHQEIRVIRSGEDEAVCIIRDVTREKMIEDQMIRGNKLEAIGQLAAGLAHEVNTPLQYIGDNLTFANEVLPELLGLFDDYRSTMKIGSELTQEILGPLLEREAAMDVDYIRENLSQVIGKALDGMAQITKIVRAMKAFEDVGRQERAHVDLNAIVDNTITVSTHTWTQAAELTLKLQPGLPFVPCIAGEISQVVLNLVVNAAQAIAEKNHHSNVKGHILVETLPCPKEQQVELRVTDDGEGIPAAIRARIFDPFFTTRKVGQGTGQGLAQVHFAVVSLHRGSVRFETEEGKGTTFIIRLPLQDPETEPEVK
jgi:PAS domain S-box-containing protein